VKNKVKTIEIRVVTRESVYFSVLCIETKL